jgi:hypothetical protein
MPLDGNGVWPAVVVAEAFGRAGVRPAFNVREGALSGGADVVAAEAFGRAGVRPAFNVREGGGGGAPGVTGDGRPA